jgi:hypothetical protein
VAGDPANFSIAGTKIKEELAVLLKVVGAPIPKGLRITALAFTIEGDRIGWSRILRRSSQWQGLSQPVSLSLRESERKDLLSV